MSDMPEPSDVVQRHVNITPCTAGRQPHTCYAAQRCVGRARSWATPRLTWGHVAPGASSLALREASEAPAGRSLRHLVIAHTGTRRSERARRGRARRAQRERHHRAARGRPHRAAGARRRPAPWDARGARELGRHALRRAGGLPTACAPPARCPIAARSPHHAPRVHEHGTSTCCLCGAVQVGRAALQLLEVVPGLTVWQLLMRDWEGRDVNQIGRQPPLSSNKAASHFPRLKQATGAPPGGRQAAHTRPPAPGHLDQALASLGHLPASLGSPRSAPPLSLRQP